MRIALLSTAPELNTWFAQAYPEVEVYGQVVPELLEHEGLLLLAFYSVEGKHYQILDLWRRYLAINGKRKKLLLLDWVPGPTANCLCATHLKGRPAEWLQKAQLVREKPQYGPMADPDILPSIEYLLLSHGSNAFQAALIVLKDRLLEVERALAKGEHVPNMMKKEAGQSLREEYHRTQWIWERAQPCFQLMPHYPQLCLYEEVQEKLGQLVEQGVMPQQKLSQAIMTYLDEVVTLITDFYGMEKEQKQ